MRKPKTTHCWTLIIETEEALLRAHQIANLPNPRAWDLRGLDDVVTETGIVSPDARWYETSNKEAALDLAALRARQYRDPFSKFVAETLIHPFFRFIGRYFKNGDRQSGNELWYAEASLLRFALITTNFLMSVVLIVAMVVLYLLQTMRAKLVAIAAFHMLFFSIVSWFTDASSIEAITAGSA